MKKIKYTVILISFLIAIVLSYIFLNYNNLELKKHYTNEDFGINNLISDIDYNSNGIDDYTDILLGAQNYVKTKPKYKSEYYDGGYPPNDIGVCTDVIWKAIQNAGYSLKDLVDKDIKENPTAYPEITKADPNIDFRRVRNLNIYFKRHTKKLTLDLSEIKEWQAGDIVVFPTHIAIISDKRNKKGIPYIIHNNGSFIYEADILENYEISGHYRWILQGEN